MDQKNEMTVIQEFYHRADAEVIAALLASAGVESVIDEDEHVSSSFLPFDRTPAFELRVRSEDSARALAVLAKCLTTKADSNSASVKLLKRNLIDSSLTAGWRVFKENPSQLILIAALLFVCHGLVGIIIKIFFSVHFQMIGVLIRSSTLRILAAVFYFFCLQELRKTPEPLSRFFTSPILRNLIIGSIIISLAYALGLILLIVPFFILMVGFSQWCFLIFDKRVSWNESLQQSWDMMNGLGWTYFIFTLYLLVLNLLGLLCLFVGVFVTLPVTMTALSAFYLRLLELRTSSS